MQIRAPLIARIRRTCHAIWSFAKYLVAALIIVLLGEIVFRGPAATVAWAAGLPMAPLVTVLFVAASIFVVELFCTFWSAAALSAIPILVLSLADRAKVAKLGVPATPTDLLLSHQYIQVSYMMWGRWAYVAMALAVVVVAALVWRAVRQNQKRHAGNRRLVVTAQLLALIALTYVVVAPDYNYYTARYRYSAVASRLDAWGIHNLNFDPLRNAMTNGQLIAFLMNTRAALLHPPVGYSEQAVADILARQDTSAPRTAETKPDVIIVMSEAFWDPALLPGVTYSNPLLNAADVTQRGKMFSPVFGGYTANTEFEVLTSVSNGLLPVGSIPYVQYVTHPTPSLADSFRAAGYRATALHPFDGNFWNRRSVYTQFGFQAFEDRETFRHRDMTGPFINDHALAQEINTQLDEGSGPQFVFAVSLQSHAPYTGGMYRYADRIDVTDSGHELTDDAKEQLRTYASGARDAVASFNEMVEHAKASGRKTIIVMFGDHLPALGDDYLLYRQTGFLRNGSPLSWTASDQERMHSVPLLVWSSDGTPMDLPADAFSPIYLGYRIKDMAGIPLSPFDELMRKMDATWPIVSQMYSKDASGGVDKGMPHGGVADDYAMVAYDILMGRRH